VGGNYRKYIAAVKELKRIADRYGKPLSQMSLNWLIKHAAITSIISGATDPEEVEENAKTAEWEMTDEVYNEIERVVRELNVVD